MAHNARKNPGRTMMWDTEDATYAATLYHGRFSDGQQKTVIVDRLGFDDNNDFEFKKSFRSKDCRVAHDKALAYMESIFEKDVEL